MFVLLQVDIKLLSKPPGYGGGIVMNVVIWMLSGVIAGWLAGLIIRGRGFGLVGDLIIGILGGILGGWLFAFFGLIVIGIIGNILAAVIGGVVLVTIVRTLRRA